MKSNEKPLSIGDVARHFGVATWCVRRVITKGLLPEPARVGPFRVFSPSDLPAIKAALKARGYLKEGAHA